KSSNRSSPALFRVMRKVGQGCHFRVIGTMSFGADTRQKCREPIAAAPIARVNKLIQHPDSQEIGTRSLNGSPLEPSEMPPVRDNTT
ncbi:MAG: hypothetical protein WD825_08270, partial [Gemmatimonadaceae bacterium]